MKLEELPKVTRRKLKRLGQGHGSGKVKTAGRGTKGQKARGKIPLTFEGGALPLIKRLPFRRGKGRNRSIQKEPVLLNLEKLNVFEKGSVVDLDTLVKKGLVSQREARKRGVKILGEGDLNIALTVKVAVSGPAGERIKKAGGNVS